MSHLLQRDFFADLRSDANRRHLLDATQLYLCALPPESRAWLHAAVRFIRRASDNVDVQLCAEKHTRYYVNSACKCEETSYPFPAPRNVRAYRL